MAKISNRSIISHILSLLLAIFITLFTILTVTRFTVLNPSYLLNKLGEADFYKQSVITLNEEIQQATQSSGFPLGMFENYLDANTYQATMETYMENAFKTGNIDIDTTAFETQLNSDIDSYLTSANIIVNAEEQQAVTTLKADLVEQYKTYLTFPALSIIVQITNLYQHYFLFAAIFLVILILITSFILYRLYHHYHRRRRFFAYGLSTSGLMCFALPAFIYFGGFINKLSLSPAYFYNFITTTINSYLLIYIVIGVVMIICANVIAYIKFSRN